MSSHPSLSSDSDVQRFTWATLADMPKFAIASYLLSFSSLVAGFIYTCKFVHRFSTYTQEATFFSTDYDTIKFGIIMISLTAFIMNTILINVESSMDKHERDGGNHWKHWFHGWLTRGLVEPIYTSTVPESFFTEFVYYIWMLLYLAVSVVMLMLMTVFFLYYCLIYSMRLTCLGTKGDAAEFVDLVSESSPDFDDMMTAAHFCQHKNSVRRVTLICFGVYTFAFMMQINLMCVITIQQYKLRHSGDLKPLISSRNLLLEPVGAAREDGHVDIDDIDAELNAMDAKVGADEVKE